MCVFVATGGHAPPVFEPADTAFYGVARLVPFRGVELGFWVPAPDRNDGLEASPS